MRQNLAWALTGLVGGLLFLAFFIFLVPENLLVSGGVALAGLLAGWLMFVRTARRTVAGVLGGDARGREARIREGWEYQRKLEAFARRAPDKAVRAKIGGIADVVGRILKDLRQDPADFPKASQFLDYYLVSTVAVVGKYLELSGRAATGEGLAALRGTEQTLDTIKAAFEKLYQQLLENELMDLDVELKVLNNTIAMEGLGQEAGPAPGQAPRR
jgi:5-bromo-4-chloroindolyl phosphate hydrolysis protein